MKCAFVASINRDIRDTLCHRILKTIIIPSPTYSINSHLFISRGVMREQSAYPDEVKEVVWRKGPWTAEEDKLLIEYVNSHGEGNWNSVAGLAGLKRNGKSCRLRWVNYLRPDLKKGEITPNEETIILELHARWGNRWSVIARSLPGRTDNEIKNYWRTNLKKKAKSPFDIDSSSSRVRQLRKQKFWRQHKKQAMIQTETSKLVPQLPQVLDKNETKSVSLVPQIRQRVSASCPNIFEGQNYCSPISNGCLGVEMNMIQNENYSFCDRLWNLDNFSWDLYKETL